MELCRRDPFVTCVILREEHLLSLQEIVDVWWDGHFPDNSTKRSDGTVPFWIRSLTQNSSADAIAATTRAIPFVDIPVIFPASASLSVIHDRAERLPIDGATDTRRVLFPDRRELVLGVLELHELQSGPEIRPLCSRSNRDADCSRNFFTLTTTVIAITYFSVRSLKK